MIIKLLYFFDPSTFWVDNFFAIFNPVGVGRICHIYLVSCGLQ